MPKSYYSIEIPWIPGNLATKWHPTDQLGPFATVSRGAFKSLYDAIVWAREHLNGCPYTIVEIKEGAE